MGFLDSIGRTVGRILNPPVREPSPPHVEPSVPRVPQTTQRGRSSFVGRPREPVAGVSGGPLQKEDVPGSSPETQRRGTQPSRAPEPEELRAATDSFAALTRGPSGQEGTWDSTTVSSDPLPVTQTTPELRDRAANYVAQHSALESQALSQLTREESEQYRQIRSSVAGDPLSGASLQQLLFSGQLTQGRDLRNEGNLLDHASSLSDPATPLAEGIHHSVVTSDLVKELANPTAISQGPRGTCMPTSVLIDLARENPAEYARITSGLSSPEGRVTLAGGTTLQRDHNTAAPDGTGRTTTQRLIGSAFMELTNGDSNYDNATNEGAGATSWDLDDLIGQLWGRDGEEINPFVTMIARLNDFNPLTWIPDAFGASPTDLLVNEMRRQIDQGNRLVVNRHADILQAHGILVTGIEGEGDDATVRFINPWGREETSRLGDFADNMHGINIIPRVG